MHLPAIKKTKADFLEIVKNIHNRKYWGQTFTYFEHETFTAKVTVSSINFEKSLINFEVASTDLYDETHKERSSVSFRIDGDDTVATLIHRIEAVIYRDIDWTLKRKAEHVVCNSASFIEFRAAEYEQVNTIIEGLDYPEDVLDAYRSKLHAAATSRINRKMEALAHEQAPLLKTELHEKIKEMLA